ncbi:MAG: purine-nucleoside phosphorylase [Alphaproteobacteria bacterium]|nr:purine-nucleoside phosphorylase [Alphaproteobacteria bacterium SS10]
MQSVEAIHAAVEEAVAVLETKKPADWTPRAVLVLGSGLSHIASAMQNSVTVPYSDIPNFIRANVEGHEGNLHMGWLGGAQVACLQGRQHLYEGPAESMEALSITIRALQKLGADILFLTAAAGSLNRSMTPGSLMMVADHINLMGTNPLLGPNDDRVGPRFPNMHNAYDMDLRSWLIDIALGDNIFLHEGIYAGVLGPNFETPAEIRMMQTIGADAVGMSVVPECLIARHCDMRVAACAAITNFAEGVGPGSPTHEETLATADICSESLTRLLFGFFETLA